MRTSIAVLWTCALLAAALPAAPLEARTEKLFRLETAPGEFREVTEAQKFDLIRNHIDFFDVTDFPAESFLQTAALTPAVYPSTFSHTATIKALFPSLNKTNLETDLTTFSSFHNRFYNSTWGVEAAQWLQSRLRAVVSAANASSAVDVLSVRHSAWLQPSTIVRIRGASNKTVVIGAHMDSINILLDEDPAVARAPGADDNGSGSVTLIESLRALLTDKTIAGGKAANTIEFHWYAAEEVGLLGSLSIFRDYQRRGVDVRAMLNQDMTGYVFPNRTEAFGMITDNTDLQLTTYMRDVVKTYCNIPSRDFECGYACSDHSSATRSGYQSAFVFEADDFYERIHTDDDSIKYLSFDHMIEHVKLQIGFAYELGMAKGL